MTFAYNPPRDLGDVEDMHGLFDNIVSAATKVASAASTVSNAVSTGAKVVDTVSTTAQRMQAAAAPVVSAARGFTGGGAAPRRATYTAPRPAAPPIMIQRARPIAAPVAMRVRSAETSGSEDTAGSSSEGSSSAVPLAIGAVLLAAAGGGAWWYFGRKGGGHASHR